MLFSTGRRWTSSLIPALTALLPLASGIQVITSNALSSCQDQSGLTASLFNVEFTPNNDTILININGISTINSFVTANFVVTAYGIEVYTGTDVDPCDQSADIDLSGLCPMSPGQLDIVANIPLSADTVASIPSIAYNIPDLDGHVQVQIYKANTTDQLACVQADLSNGKTVYQKGVGWASAVVAGSALLTSAVVAGLGHSSTATHVAANAMTLFGFFQVQAIFGMTAIPLPPIVSAWTQNFQWSMGIINVDFVQKIASWYQQSTGGAASTIISNLNVISVTVIKRNLQPLLETAQPIYTRAMAKGFAATNELVRRQDQTTTPAAAVTVRGIERVGFRAGIEPSNIFMTGYIFFVIFVFLVCIGVLAFRYALELLIKSGKMKSDKFQDFRNGWTTVLRGILFRLILIGFPQMCILCFWELIHQDSAGEEAIAVITIITILVMLTWACVKVWMLARRSISMHKNPAYILYSDPVCLHKWGFLYVQFRAAAYWFIIPTLVFLLVVGLFVAFAQGSDLTQSIALLILNAAFLVAISILRPYMDKKTNGLNIGIASVNFVSSILFLFFTDIFGLPGLVVGVMGIVFFIMNAAAALVLIVLVLVGMGYAIFSKNPDVRYQPMRDDRGSFIKSQSALNTELDALGATARGESKAPYGREFDADSMDGGSYTSERHDGYGRLHPTKPFDSQRSTTTYDSSPFRTTSMTSSLGHSGPPPPRVASPWQRGAGYDG